PPRRAANGRQIGVNKRKSPEAGLSGRCDPPLQGQHADPITGAWVTVTGQRPEGSDESGLHYPPRAIRQCFSSWSKRSTFTGLDVKSCKARKMPSWCCNSRCCGPTTMPVVAEIALP